MKYALYGFDLNGTLIDTMKRDYSTECKVVRRLGGRPPSMQEFRNNVGVISWKEYYATFGVEDWRKAWDVFFSLDARLNSKNKSTPQAKKVLVTLASAKKPVFLVTMSEISSVYKHLRNTGLDTFFNEQNIYCATDSKCYEIMAACKKTGIEPAQTIFTGDTVKDIISAKAAGAVSVGIANDLYSYNPHHIIIAEKPDHVITRLEELLRL